QVSDMNSSFVQHRSAVRRPTDQGDCELADGPPGRDRTGMSDYDKPIAFSPEDLGVGRLAQPRGTLRHGVEHGMEVGRRAADDSPELGCRRLLLVRLSQVATARLELPKRLRLALQRLRQLLLEVADPRAFVVPRALGFAALALHALASPTHWLLLDHAMNR